MSSTPIALHVSQIYTSCVTKACDRSRFNSLMHLLTRICRCPHVCVCMACRYEEALDDAEKVVELKPDWPRGWHRKGDAYYGLGEFQSAKRSYEESLRLDPSSASVKSALDQVNARLSGPPPSEMPGGGPFGAGFGGGNPFDSCACCIFFLFLCSHLLSSEF